MGEGCLPGPLPRNSPFVTFTLLGTRQIGNQCLLTMDGAPSGKRLHFDRLLSGDCYTASGKSGDWELRNWAVRSLSQQTVDGLASCGFLGHAQQELLVVRLARATRKRQRGSDQFSTSLGRENFSHNRRARRDSRLDHDQPQKSPHCVGADTHPIGNFFVPYALQHVHQHFFFALGEVELLADLRQRNWFRGRSFQ